MVQEAEEHSEEDRLIKERTGEKNSLESYLYNTKNVLDDEEGGVASKVSDADKEVSLLNLPDDFNCSNETRIRDNDQILVLGR